MTRSFSPARLAAAMFSVALAATAAPAQGTLGKEDAEQLRASLLADIETMRGKFVGLAEAFPQDKYSWRPMEGVRSVSEVLMLAAFEGYAFVPRSFGAAAAALGTREEMAKLRELSDKAQVIDQLNKGFAHARSQLQSVAPDVLGATRSLFGQTQSATAIALLVHGDMHEHLGQLIAYARMNRIVPPWSK